MVLSTDVVKVLGEALDFPFPFLWKLPRPKVIQTGAFFELAVAYPQFLNLFSELHRYFLFICSLKENQKSTLGLGQKSNLNRI